MRRMTYFTDAPQFQFRGETHEDFAERCREFFCLITGQGLPANWR